MNSFSNARHVGLALLFSVFALAPMSAAWAQTQSIGTAGLLGVGQGQPSSGGGMAGMGETGQAGMAQPGFQQLGMPVPNLFTRPDFGAQDAQRYNLSPLRTPKLAPPSQFQKFVQESTGKLLPVYGASLFENPVAYAADAAAPAPEEYAKGLQ